jgi:hypothetical protein
MDQTEVISIIYYCFNVISHPGHIYEGLMYASQGLLVRTENHYLELSVKICSSMIWKDTTNNKVKFMDILTLHVTQLQTKFGLNKHLLPRRRHVEHRP